MIGYVAATNIWPADDYAQACALYDKAEKAIVQVLQEVPPLAADYE